MSNFEHIFKINIISPNGWQYYLCGQYGVVYFKSRARAEQCVKQKFNKSVDYTIIKCSLNDALESGIRGHL